MLKLTSLRVHVASNLAGNKNKICSNN